MVFRFLVAVALVQVCLGQGRVAGAGELVVYGDDWTLSDYAFDAQPERSEALASAVANVFTGGGTGNFLAISDSVVVFPFGPRGVLGDELASTMTGLGHSWTVDQDAEFSYANLSQYDAVYLSGTIGTAPDEITALSEYVTAGGGVFLMAGTCDFDSPAEESAAWAPLLNPFGLTLGDTYFGGSDGSISEVGTVSPASPFDNVTSLSWSLGSMTTVLDANDPRTSVAMRADFSAAGGGPQGNTNDVMAIYSSPFLPGDFNDDGLVDSVDYAVWRESTGQSVLLPGDPTPGDVDDSDFLVWRDNYGASVQAPAATANLAPEPAALWLIAAGLSLAVRRRA